MALICDWCHNTPHDDELYNIEFDGAELNVCYYCYDDIQHYKRRKY